MYIRGFGLNERHLKSNILCANEKSATNICPIASWLVYSENYLNFKQEYEIDEMYAALIDKSNVYLVTADHVFVNGQTELEVVSTYIKEHYLVEQLQIQEITNFDNKIYVYKLSR